MGMWFLSRRDRPWFSVDGSDFPWFLGVFFLLGVIFCLVSDAGDFRSSNRRPRSSLDRIRGSPCLSVERWGMGGFFPCAGGAPGCFGPIPDSVFCASEPGAFEGAIAVVFCVTGEADESPPGQRGGLVLLFFLQIRLPAFFKIRQHTIQRDRYKTFISREALL